MTVQLWAELHSSQPYLASKVDELEAGPFTALYRLSVHSFLSGLPKMNENSRSLYFVLIMFYAPLYFVVSFSFY